MGNEFPRREIFFRERGRLVAGIEAHATSFRCKINRLLVGGPLARLMHVISV